MKRDRVFVAHQERLWQHITLTDKTLRWTPKLGEVPEGLIFTIRVTDTDLAYAEQTFKVPAQSDVPPNASPRFTSVPTGPAVVGQTYRYQGKAVDPDGDDLIYGIDTATQALGADIDPATGLLTWQPTTAGNTDLVVTVTDGVNEPITQTFTLSVIRENTAPTITSVPAGPARVGSAWTYLVRATDSDPGDQALLQYRLTSPAEPPDEIEFDEASGTLTWTPGTAGSQPLTIEVDDTRGGVATQTFTIGAQVPAGTGNAPAITSSPQGPAYVGRVWTYLATATDADGDPISWTVTSAPAGLTHETFANKLRLTWTPAAGDLAAAPHTITLQADDGDPVSGYATQSFRLGVVDVNQPPTITSLPTGPAYKDVAWTYTVTASDVDDPPENRTYSLDPASQIPTNAIDGSTGLIAWTGTVPGSYAVIVRVSDGRGGEATQRFTLNVVDQAVPSNLPPVIRSLPPNSVRQGDVYSYALDAYDPNGDALQYQLTTAPSGMTVDPSGVLRWRAGMIGDYAVTVSVSDGVNTPVEQQFPLEVLAPVAANEPPVIVSNPTGPAVRDRPWTYEVIGEDPNGDAITFSVTATDSGGDPVAMNITPSATHPATQAVITWTPTAGGNVDVVVTATDGHRSSSQSFTLRALDNAPPVIDSTPTQTVSLRALHQYTVHAADPNTSDVIRYALQDFRQLVAIGGLQPATMPGVVAGTGQLTWTPDAPGLYEVTVSANDQRGGTDTQTYQLQVIDPNHNNPPLVDFAPRREVPFGVAMIYQVPASDPEGDPLTFTPVLSSLPPGMTLSPTGLLTWTPTAEQLSPPDYTVSLSVSDGENIVPVQAQLTVVQQLQNQPPEFTSTAPTSAIANYRYSYDAAAVDPDGDSVVFSLAGPGSPAPAPAGMTIDSQTGLIQWRPTVSQVGSHAFTVVASDTLGLRDEQVVTVTVAGANRPPVIESDPPVLAVRNSLYDYTIRASDPDGHRLTYSLAPNSELSASDPNVDFDPTTGRLRWTPDALGVFYVQINVVDEFGMGVGQGYRVQILATAPNTAPRITSPIPEVLMAEVDQAFALTVTADDPNAGDTVSITMLEPGTLPGSGTFTRHDGNPASGSLAWTPADTGLVWFQFQASDGQATASQRFAILVTPANNPPTVETIGEQTVPQGAELQVDVDAADADGDSLEYALDAASLDRGLTIDEFGRIRWQTGQGDLGAFEVTVSVTDNRIAAPLETTFRVSVVADNTGPKVTILPDRTAAEIGETVAILVHAIDDVAVAAGSKTLTLVSVTQGGVTTPLNQALALDAAGRAQLTLTAAHLGELRFEATARDINDNLSPTATVSVYVADPTNVAAPTAAIALPTDGQAVTAPVDVVGTVTDDVAIRDWQLTYTPLDGGQSGLIAEGTGAIDNGVLGRFDPTILRNGMYRLDLVVTDTGNNTSSDSVTVEVEGSLKLGNFTLSFVDLEVPVAGLPITITRSYDTLDADVEGDFGYGWRMDVANTKVNIDYGNAPELGLDRYRPFVNGSRVVVTLPDGTKEGFTFYAKPNQAFFGLVFDYLPTFIPDYGVKSTLTVAPAVLTDTRFGDGTYLGDGQTTYSPLNPMFGASFTLTLRNGNELVIDAESGQLSQIVDRTGNTLTFTGMGIEHSAGRSIQFERDFHGRITAVIAPDGTPNDLSDNPRVTYAYDARGDLRSVTDRSGSTMQFVYRTDQEHYLEQIIDPLGRPAARTEFYEDGRVKTLTDVAGKTIQYTYDANGKTQSITDQLGHTTVQKLDGRGNLIREVDPTGVITKRTFDAKDRMLTETQVIGLDDATSGENNDLTVVHRFNEAGDEIETIDAYGNVQVTTFGEFGETLAETDIFRNTTTYQYDPQTGNVTGITDAYGRTKGMVSDDKGNLTLIRDANGNTVLDATYNAYGEVLTSKVHTGRTTYNSYTSDGEDEASWYFEGSGAAELQYLEITQYDESGRVIGTTSAVLPSGQFITSNFATAVIPPDCVVATTSSSFNLLGQATSETGPDGLRIEYVYDVTGREIQSRTQQVDSSGDVVWQIVRTVYDAAGRAVARTDPYPAGSTAPILGVRMSYDAAGRMQATERLSGMAIDIIGSGATGQSVLTSPGTVVSSSSTEYDSSGRMIGAVDEFGRESRTTYNAKGAIVETRRQSFDEDDEPVWLVNRTVFDSFGRATLATDTYVEGSPAPIFATRTIYDDRGRVVETIRLRGVSVSLLNGETDVAAGGTPVTSSRVLYDAAGRVERTIASDGQVMRNVYNSLGRQIATIGHSVPATEVGLTGYPAGTLVALRSETEYDSQGRVSKQRTNVRHITNPDGSEEVDSSQAIEVRFEYDGADNLLKTIYGDGSFTRREYDAQNRVVAEIDALGNRIEMEYDDQSRLAAVSLPAVPHPTLRDASNNPLLVRPRWQYQYDAQGNLIQIRDNFAQISPSDIRTDHNGAAGDDTRITTFQLNSRGQQTGRTLPSGNTEEIRYDVRGRQIVHVSFEGVVEQRVYDDTSVGGGRLAERRFFDSLTAFDDGAGTPAESVSYRYDAFGREISATHHRADGVLDTYSRTYSAEGRVIEESSPTGIVHYEFDALGRQRRVWTAQPANPTAPVSDVHYSYNALGRLSQVDTVMRDGLPVDSKPTLEGNQPEVAKYFYDLLGRLDRAELPGLVEDYTFDPQGQVQTIRQFVPDANNSVLTDNAPVAEYGYTYRVDGKRTGMIEKVWFDDDSNPVTPAVEVSTTYAWTYDNAGRLTSEAIDHFDAALDRTESFVMNLVGNRVRRTVDLASTPALVDQVFSSEYDANDRLLEETLDLGNDETVDQITNYDWGVSAEDPDGVTQQLGTTVRNGAGITTSRQVLSCNLQGQLAAVVSESFDGSGNVTARTRVGYQYDLAGIRNIAIEAADADLNNEFSSSERTGSTEYLVDHQSLTGFPQTLIETTKNAAGQPIRRVSYTFGLDEITQTVSQLAPATGAVTASETHTFGHDAHASVRVLVDAAGAILQAYSYTAFGELLAIHNGAGVFVSASAADALTNLLYSGEAFDSRTGWQSLRARWYRPETGRFERSDPVLGDLTSPFSFNKYAYTSGDPIQFGDPTGHFEGLVGMLMSMAIGGDMRKKDGIGSAQAYRTARQFERAIDFLQRILEIALKVGEGDYAGAIASLTGVDPWELINLKKTVTSQSLSGMSLTNLAVAGLAAAPPIHFSLGLPKGGKVGGAIRKIEKFLGMSNKTQEIIGEIGAWLIASLLGFEDSRLERPRNRRHGPDLVLRHANKPDLWAIVEAKGGTSTLGTSRLTSPPAGMIWPAGTSSPYPQMGKVWLQYWIRKTIAANAGTPVGSEFNQAFNATPGPFVTTIVSLNLRRAKEFKIAAQVFAQKVGIGFNPWPAGF